MGSCHRLPGVGQTPEKMWSSFILAAVRVGLVTMFL